MRRIHNNMRRTVSVLMSLSLCLLAACGSGSKEAEAPEETYEVRKGDFAEKEKQEINQPQPLREDKSVYKDDDETSVVTMWLTVRPGNEAENTDHTWAEINTYSAYYYEDRGIPRYNCEAILQVGDENGPVEGEFGYGETVPNAAVQVRGQSSSKSEQKNYKVRIKEGKGEWRGQRTLALNKHVSDKVRFINKLSYDLMKDVPQMAAARTQFVHLYVKDETEGGNGEFQDYGLYTQVEQMNKTYLKNHGLDNKGYFYKLNVFEWLEYEDVMKLEEDPDFDSAAFEFYLEPKGSHDHSKLHELIRLVNNYTVPIDEIVEKHFDVENICYWIAFQILIGNNDSASRNVFIYSPLNSDKWYFISWDNDAAFSRTYHSLQNSSEGLSWEKGLTQFVRCVIFERMFKEEKYRKALDDAINDLRTNYLTEERVDKMVKEYREIVRPYINSVPDVEYAHHLELFDTLTDSLASEVEINYQYYLESLEKSWPFYVGLPEKQKDGRLKFVWDASYDLDNEPITYTCILAADSKFQQVLAQADDLKVPEAVFDVSLSPGSYFLRVQATNASGYTQECYDYYSGDDKVYGCKCFSVTENGEFIEYEE